MGPSRYCPPRLTSVDRSAIVGNPNPKKISTSYVEWLHLLNRVWCRRLTRLVDAFCRKVDNLDAALGLHYWVYNFARQHGAHHLTRAQALGIEANPLTIHDLLDLLDSRTDMTDKEEGFRSHLTTGPARSSSMQALPPGSHERAGSFTLWQVLVAQGICQQ
jgi:hypothetical protein